jgi:guanylate kinase
MSSSCLASVKSKQERIHLSYWSPSPSKTAAKVFVVIGPSGVGKSTMLEKLQERGVLFEKIISHTTRPMRPSEQNGVDYVFITQEDYKEKERREEFVISTEVHGNLYGTSKTFIYEKLEKEINLVCDLNTEAAKKMKALFKEKVVTIFIAPPSVEELKRRLVERNTDSEEALAIRLKNADEELNQQDQFDYKIVNDDLLSAVQKLEGIFHHHRRLL